MKGKNEMDNRIEKRVSVLMQHIAPFVALWDQDKVMDFVVVNKIDMSDVQRLMGAYHLNVNEALVMALVCRRQLGEAGVSMEVARVSVMHVIEHVECYRSNSGNKTWKCFDDDGTIIYLRQSHRGQLIEAGVWYMLDQMQIGDDWEADDAMVYTVEDGDFRKPIRFEGAWVLENPVVSGPTSARLKGRQWAYGLVKGGDFVVVDFETTGLDEPHAIEVGVIDHEGNVLLDQRIKPPEGVEIDAGATAVHGITLERLKDCPNWEQVVEGFEAAIRDKIVVIYNKKFDQAVIDRAYKSAQLRPMYWTPTRYDCAMVKYAEYNGEYVDGEPKWVKLVDAAKAMGVEVSGEHSAVGDCRMTLGVVNAMAEMAEIPF